MSSYNTIQRHLWSPNVVCHCSSFSLGFEAIKAPSPLTIRLARVRTPLPVLAWNNHTICKQMPTGSCEKALREKRPLVGNYKRFLDRNALGVQCVTNDIFLKYYARSPSIHFQWFSNHFSFQISVDHYSCDLKMHKTSEGKMLQFFPHGLNVET